MILAPLEQTETQKQLSTGGVLVLVCENVMLRLSVLNI